MSGKAPVTVGVSLLIWLAGLVFGLGAGTVFVYHLLSSSHASQAAPLPAPPATPR
jgi:hypothetical protein